MMESSFGPFLMVPTLLPPFRLPCGLNAQTLRLGFDCTVASPNEGSVADERPVSGTVVGDSWAVSVFDGVFSVEFPVEGSFAEEWPTSGTFIGVSCTWSGFVVDLSVLLPGDFSVEWPVEGSFAEACPVSGTFDGESCTGCEGEELLPD